MTWECSTVSAVKEEAGDETHLLVFPLGGQEATLGLCLSRQRHRHHDRGEVVDIRRVTAEVGVSDQTRGRRRGDSRIVISVRVLALGKSVNEVELILSQSDVGTVELVLDGRPIVESISLASGTSENSNAPSSICILDSLEEPIEFVTRRRSHNLLAVNVVSNVRQIVVKVLRDVSNPVRSLPAFLISFNLLQTNADNRPPPYCCHSRTQHRSPRPRWSSRHP